MISRLSSPRTLAALAAAAAFVVPVAAFADTSTVPVTTVVGALGTLPAVVWLGCSPVRTLREIPVQAAAS